jgi:hypothetical protein
MVNGDPGSGASEPSLLILNPLISGASAWPRKKNWAETVVAIGVGVGVGVGEIVGVGVGEGPPMTTRRGEITHPAMIKKNMKVPAMSNPR